MGNPVFSFSKVKREQCKASILIEGLSGSGKTGLALVLAKILAGTWDGVYAIDTENKSIPLYDGIDCSLGDKFGDFQVADFTADIGYKPTNYMAFREAAIQNGCKALVQDSITHAWSAKGGILDIVSDLKKDNRRYQQDSYAAWGDEAVVKEKNLLMQMFRDSRCHIISTVRVKEKMEYDKNEQGKTILRSLGEQQIMQADVKYEPDLVLSMEEPGSKDHAPKARVTKSRCAILEKDQVYEFTESLCNQIKQYLEEGSSPEALKEMQRKEYVEGIKEYLDNHKNAVPVWNQLKANKGFADTKLADMPLNTLKELFVQLTVD